MYLDIHGGAWIQGGGEVCRSSALFTSAIYGARVWAVDYRMPPDHPYPTPLDDCLAAYRALLAERSPEEIIVGGVSAGGNLAAALILRARDEGLPLPAAVVLNTPATDLTGAGDTWQTNLGLDTVLTGSSQSAMLLYAAGHDLRDPYISPLFGDLRGFPPTMLSSGTRDRLLSDTVRMHRALRARACPPNCTCRRPRPRRVPGQGARRSPARQGDPPVPQRALDPRRPVRDAAIPSFHPERDGGVCVAGNDLDAYVLCYSNG